MFFGGLDSFHLENKGMEVRIRESYPSDLTDGQWALIEPMLPVPVSSGAPRTTRLRDVVNGIFFLLSSGCRWKDLPRDYPPEGTVRDYFHQWRRSGLWGRIHDALRREVRKSEGRDSEPSAGVIDSQSVKATRMAGIRGYDAGKKNQRGEASSDGRHTGPGGGGGGALRRHSGS
jgi:transposase